MPRIYVTTDDGTVVETLDSTWVEQLATTRHRDAEPIVADLRFAIYKAQQEQVLVGRRALTRIATW